MPKSKLRKKQHACHITRSSVICILAEISEDKIVETWIIFSLTSTDLTWYWFVVPQDEWWCRQQDEEAGGRLLSAEAGGRRCKPETM